MRGIQANWRTTIAGIGLILAAVGTAIVAVTDDDPSTVIQAEVLVTQIMCGLALIFARDAAVSSEKSGAK